MIPPDTSVPASRQNNLLPPLLFATGAGLLVLGRLLLYFPLPTPVCGLRAWTGWPCPFCGSTRAVMAAAQGNWLEALRLNPLTCGIGLLIALWFGLWLWDQVCGTHLDRALRRRVRPALAGWIAGSAVAANWIYLIGSAIR